MSKYARSAKSKAKQPVARVATPSAVIAANKPCDSLKHQSSAKDVLSQRYNDLGSWRIVAYELVENPGTLYNIAKHSRKASITLINKLNHIYGCHLKPERKVSVFPLQCGHSPSGDRCYICHPAQPKRTRQPDPVVRVKRVDDARIAVLSALYAQSGIGEEVYRVRVKSPADGMTV